MSSRTNHQRLVALEKQMDEAAANFDFEKAAALRDEIARLRGEADDIVGQPPPDRSVWDRMPRCANHQKAG